MPVTVSAPQVTALRRYPVKSMGGEALATVELDPRGLVGDRGYAVRDAEARLASGKNTKRLVRRDGIFAYSARTADAGVEVSGPSGTWVVGDPALDRALSLDLSAAVTVAPEDDVPHFDDGSVSLIGTATLEWCARELGADADARRLRPNIVVATSEPFEEEGWSGDVRIGEVVLRPTGRIERCRTIDLAQDGVETRTRWLKPLGDQRDMRVAIYLDVVTPGRIAVGDVVALP
ncbi:MOSC domain-containing protein [Demequina muriae]|uniref:MOSC domain-containing protein n=1 Tax=Demequina muriae TaxID=3051664 RepID=A0ABT8GG98_9MICO|nr:MOSC domain-containing protein [Demequina sp. EGI L300058]MDN4480453.1 MOSC domain-containing protein [Demequina sp. EGI L300058]